MLGARRCYDGNGDGEKCKFCSSSSSIGQGWKVRGTLKESSKRISLVVLGLTHVNSLGTIVFSCVLVLTAETMG